MIFVTKDEKVKAFSMYLDGVPIQEIGRKLGVTKQAISDMFNTYHVQKVNVRKLANACVYPALTAFILENQMDIMKFFTVLYKGSPKEIYGDNTWYYYGTFIKNRVSGKSAFTSAEWLRLREVTGIPLEQLMDSDGAVKLAPRIRKTNEDKSE